MGFQVCLASLGNHFCSMPKGTQGKPKVTKHMTSGSEAEEGEAEDTSVSRPQKRKAAKASNRSQKRQKVQGQGGEDDNEAKVVADVSGDFDEELFYVGRSIVKMAARAAALPVEEVDK